MDLGFVSKSLGNLPGDNSTSLCPHRSTEAPGLAAELREPTGGSRAGLTLPTPLAAGQGEVDEGPFLGHLTTGLLANTGRRDTAGPTATPGSKLNQEDAVCSPVSVRQKQCLRTMFGRGKRRQWPSCSWKETCQGPETLGVLPCFEDPTSHTSQASPPGWPRQRGLR